ncbi:Metallo-dependent hydrolase [Poronia punctata]|nr:Metallo-dependent hydrolase [Poronia punctata]
MCVHSNEAADADTQGTSLGDVRPGDSKPSSEPFPWELGVFDAHCHPTDTMASISSIPSMKARVLTVMATRSQDQELVSVVASEHGVRDGKALLSSDLALSDSNRIIPSFGWHPWFSYQLYDDTVPNPTYDGTQAGKIAHYDQVLAPAPSLKDVSFSEGLCNPRPLSEFLQDTRKRLEKFPLGLVGEIGLDKAFRLPVNWSSDLQIEREEGLTPGGREGRRLSPYRVQMAHQIAILKAQLKLAGELGRPVSVHGVQAHGMLYETIAECWKGFEKEVLSRRQRRQIAPGAEDFTSSADDSDVESDAAPSTHIKARDKHEFKSKPFPPRICLHSYSGPVEQLKLYIHPSVPAKVYFSFSMAINWGAGGKQKIEEVLLVVPDNRILVESDLHTAGNQMDDDLEEVCRKICLVKGWELRKGVEMLARNWQEFLLG